MKKSTAAATAIARYAESERPGFSPGKTESESVQVSSTKTTSQLQWIAIRIPATRPTSEAVVHGVAGEERSPAKITSTLSPS